MKFTANTIMTLAITMGGSSLAAPVASVPFAEYFSVAELGSNWTNHLDRSNSIALKDGALEFHAWANARAHTVRAFGLDNVRVSCRLKAGASSTPVSLFLSWDASDFIQFGLNSPANGRLNVREVLSTYPHDCDLGAVVADEWQFVAVELANDCIRYLAGSDGKKSTTVHISPRPARLAGAPKLLVLGQDADGKLFDRPTPWLSVPSTETAGVSSIRDLRIEALAKNQQTASVSERRLLASQERDLFGEQELALRDDPSFASVSRHYPAMKWPREIVGVKDHPFDIGVAPDGSLQLSDNIADYEKPTAFFKTGDCRFGSSNDSCSKKLLNGWMPVVVASDSHDGLELEQIVFGWSKEFSPDEPLFGYVQFRATNPTDSARNVNLQLVFTSTTNTPLPLGWQLKLPAHGIQTVSVRVPYQILESRADEVTAGEFEGRLAETTAYWEKLIARGSCFEIPEARVQNAYRAWIAYNFLNVAKRKGVYEVCDGSGFYGKVYGYSAALFCNSMDLLGYYKFAETYCDSLLSFAHTNGLLAVNFGDTDTGTALWMMAEHYRLTRDGDWLRLNAPKMRKMCQWIVGQRHAALANATKEPAVTRGLIRYQPYADLLHPAADYFSNGYLWKGLDATAQVFAEIGLSNEAAELQREADDYLKDIRASMDAAVFTDHGMTILPMIPDTRELWKESDGSANGYYGIIASCLLEAGVPAWNDPKSKLIVNALEQRGGLVAGIAQFHDMADHAYSYGYWMNCLQRDDVDRVILGFYGSLAYGMSRGTYSAVECTAIRSGENYWMLPHTYSNTQQLRLLRNMLVREDGKTLRLGQAIPRGWLGAGQHVAVMDAPTLFGAVSYSIEANSDGSMRVNLSPPTRTAPEEILICLRDPKHRQIDRVKLVGAAKVKFSKNTIRLSEIGSPVTMDAAFK